MKVRVIDYRSGKVITPGRLAGKVRHDKRYPVPVRCLRPAK